MILHDIPREISIPQRLIYAMHGLYCDIFLDTFIIARDTGNLFVQEINMWTNLGTQEHPHSTYWSDMGKQFEMGTRGARGMIPLDMSAFTISFATHENDISNRR